jgi:NADH-quinone oxidoreductase subunit E
MVTENMLQKIRELERRYPDRQSLVMGALWVVQRSRGWKLTKADLGEIAGILNMSPVEVEAVAKFYTMYNVVEHIGGRYHIQICHNISCSLLGAERLIDHLETTLGIKPGETTRDKRFSLTTVECLGSCGTAPMMQINDDYYENLTTDGVDEILKRLK